jgi:hypothetical protein
MATRMSVPRISIGWPTSGCDSSTYTANGGSLRIAFARSWKTHATQAMDGGNPQAKRS